MSTTTPPSSRTSTSSRSPSNAWSSWRRVCTCHYRGGVVSLLTRRRSRVEADLCRVCYLVSFPSSIFFPYLSRDQAILTASPYSDEHDQELDSLLVGPIPVGVNKFIFEADPPDTKRIPDAEI